MVTSVVLPPKMYIYSAKANAIKEVETWASEVGGRDSSVRSGGQIVDNITEGRMLKTKVMELSKERYKFMVQSDYDKKFFVEAQQRKLKAMPELLRRVDVEYWLSKNPKRRRAAAPPQPAAAPPPPRPSLQRGPPPAPAVAPAADPPPIACGRRSPQIPGRGAGDTKPRLVTSSLGTAPTSDRRLPERECICAPAADQPKPLHLRRRQTLASISVGDAQASLHHPPWSSDRRDGLHATAPSVAPRRASSSAFGERHAAGDSRRAVADERYVKLEDSLADVYACACPREVSEIVDACRALHVASVAGTKYIKPKLGGHIMEYLRMRKLIK